MSETTIKVLKNGPYSVSGTFVVLDADGNRIETKEKAALCRCGASTNKPFCDGTHSKIGFEAAAQAVPQSKD
jgi:3-phenylpropionate/trans-cinnamate dioxygenase ferredoxin subunit